MIVLTYIKLHQSAMRDIVLLSGSCYLKKREREKKRHLSTLTLTCFNKKSSVLQ